MFDYQSLSPHGGEQEFVVERQFNAPRTLMFQVFTQPEHLKRWWAPQPYTISTCTIDLRPSTWGLRNIHDRIGGNEQRRTGHAETSNQSRAE